MSREESTRTPTEKQYDLLRALGSGAMLVSGRHGRTIPQLEKHGWIAPEKPGDDNGFRITPAGLCALALAVEKFGLPEVGPRKDPPPTPIMVRLRQERDDAREQRDAARRELSYARGALSRCQRTIGEVLDAA